MYSKCIETDIKLSYECIEELFAAQNNCNVSYIYEDYLKSNNDNYIFYFLDFYKFEEKLIPVMLKYKVNGYVYFDNEDVDYCLNSKYFGYDFNGNGGYKKLFGTIVFEEAK